MRPELKKVIGIFSAWILMAAALWILLPADWHWLAWIPIFFIIVALVASGIGILVMRLAPPKPVVAMVNNKKITSCMFCPARYMKDNPVSQNFPICKCMDAGGRTCYNPSTVPRWCPNAVK